MVDGLSKSYTMYVTPENNLDTNKLSWVKVLFYEMLT